MKTKSLTPETLAKEVSKLNKEGEENIDLIIDGINRTLVSQMRNNLKFNKPNKDLVIFCDEILRPDKNWAKYSVKNAENALKAFEKGWNIKLINHWTDTSGRVEFTPKKVIKN